jgi:hypothetical protein
MTDLDTFVHLSDNEIARLVSEQGQQVCVFPISGIQRWYTMEYGNQVNGDLASQYMNEITKKLLDIYGLFFSQGIHTLVSPLHGLARDDGEQDSSLRRLEILTTHTDFLYFYNKFNVRVHFFGDYRRQLAGTSYSYLSDQFERLSRYTRKNTRHRLFYGLFTGNAAENIADLSVRHFIRTGQVPDRHTLMELYYGEAIEAADLFIGFDTFNPADYPLLDFAEENMYFSAAPSFYLTKEQIRRILHDRLHQRDRKELDDAQLSDTELAALKDFYRAQRNTTLGLGHMRPCTWIPSHQP